MELVKREDHWALYNEDGHKIAATIPGCNSKLSIKNCEAIENGYDLDELARQEAEKIHIKSSHEDWDVWECLVREEAHSIKIGMVKMLELMGDKKFSQEDILKAIAFDQYHFEYGEITSYKKDEEKEEFIQSLQQTEWGVEIITKPYTEVNEGFELESKREVKLDADGCLILRRI